ncbi:MAG: hypothetical protein ABIH37_01650 [archaeon]
MFKRLLQEEERILKATIRNQKIHMRAVEEAEKKESYVPPRFPTDFNRGYSYKK